MFYTEKIASHIIKLNYNDIPFKVIKKAKYCIIDSVGCAIGGSQTNVGKICIKSILQFDFNPEVLIWGTDKKSSLFISVFINSTFANAMDFDDTYVGHPGATIIPSAFALAEYLGSSGKELVEAVVTGYEVQERIGEALIPTSERIKKVKGFGTFQIFGATVCAAKLLRLNKQQIANALGIAGSNAPIPSIKKTIDNELGATMVKNNYGIASFNGILSALLAKNGFIGPINIFEGDTGFWIMSGSDQFFSERLVKEFGVNFKILDVSFKPYPCCRYLHSSIDAILNTIKLYKIDVSKIDSILVKTIPYVVKYYSNKIPKNYIDVMFSLPFVISLAILKVPPGIEWFSEDNIKSKKLLNYAKKIELEALPNYIIETDKVISDKIPSNVIIRVGCNNYNAKVDYPLGCSHNPMNINHLKEKFLRLSENVIGKEKSLRLFEQLINIESIDNVREITKI